MYRAGLHRARCRRGSHETRNAIAAVEEQFEQLRHGRDVLRKHASTAPRDFRDRHKADDVKQWVFTPEFEKRVESDCCATRTAPEEAAAQIALEEAKKLVEGALARAQEVARYWDTQTVLRWHRVLEQVRERQPPSIGTERPDEPGRGTARIRVPERR